MGAGPVSLVAFLAVLATTPAACGGSPRTASPTAPGPEITLVVADAAPRVTGSIAELADADLLGDGLRHVVDVRVELVTEPDETVIATHRRRCALTYDAWMRSYAVELVTSDDERPASGRVGPGTPTDSLGAAPPPCLELDAPLVVDESDVPAAGTALHADVLARLDPPSAEAIHGLRAWLRDPDRTDTWPPTFFGTIAQLFVARSVLAPTRTRTYRTFSATWPGAGGPP